jgi:biopolymer transport protein ExbD
MASSTTKPGEVITDINVTPLVDVVLVLLIVLMVTAGYVVSKNIPVDLPKGATGEVTHLTLAIGISANGDTYVQAAKVDAPSLRATIRRSHERDPATRAVIAADGSTRHRDVIAVIDLLRQEGVNQFAINVQPDELARP